MTLITCFKNCLTPLQINAQALSYGGVDFSLCKPFGFQTGQANCSFAGVCLHLVANPGMTSSSTSQIC